MKILYVYDVAANACQYAKWMRRAGHEAWVINQANHFGYMQMYGETYIPDLDECWRVIRKVAPEYDILHLMTAYQNLPQLYPFHKPTVIQYVGTEIVVAHQPMRKHTTKFAKEVVINEYLAQYAPDAVHIPYGADTDYFKPSDKPGSGYLTFDMDYIEKEKGREGLEFKLAARNLTYAQMPEALRQYEGYIDIKFDKNYKGILPALSKTGVEALACGLRVMNWKREWLQGLPQERTPEAITKQLIELYEGVLN